MVKVVDFTSWTASPPERRPGETLEEYIIRRGTRMRKLQAQFAVYAEELEAIDDGPEAERLIEAIHALMDEEAHLWLREGEESIPYGFRCFLSPEEFEEESQAIEEALQAYEEFREDMKALEEAREAGRIDEVRRLEPVERRMREACRRILEPNQEAVEAQRYLGDSGEARHHVIADDLNRARTELAAACADDRPDRIHLELEERRLRELWERACKDAAEAREELLAQGLIRPRTDADRTAAGR